MNPDPYADVRPRGWLGDRLRAIQNPRKWRWNAYVRACRAIPAHSPVAGSTSWKKINDRRLWMILNTTERHNPDGPEAEEFRALQRVAGEASCGQLVAMNFLLARLLRKLRRERKSGKR